DGRADTVVVGAVADVDHAHALHGVGRDGFEGRDDQVGGLGRVEAGVGQDVALHDAAADVHPRLLEEAVVLLRIIRVVVGRHAVHVGLGGDALHVARH